jgi:hypothetical protein
MYRAVVEGKKNESEYGILGHTKKKKNSTRA